MQVREPKHVLTTRHEEVARDIARKTGQTGYR
jgi:hypothetical protein